MIMRHIANDQQEFMILTFWLCCALLPCLADPISSDNATSHRYETIYPQRPVHIQMPKATTPVLQKYISSPSVELKTLGTLSVNLAHRYNKSAVGVSSSVGGLGLASLAQSHINLGALGASKHRYKFTQDKPQGSALSYTNRYDNSGKRTHSVSWSSPDDTAHSETVSMRVMGHSINPRVASRLHPDVSPVKAKKLRKILGGSLDREWTSDVPPRILRRGISNSAEKVNDQKLKDEVKNLNLSLQNMLGANHAIPEEHMEAFRSWLLDKATCEMEFIWEDLGPLYWPRWIRRGVCINRQGHSCSWPPGMKCRFSGSRALKLLHWKCEDSVQTQTRKRAAEQRNLRRAVANTFESRFYDMKPVQSTEDELPRLSLRDTHRSLSLHFIRRKQPRRQLRTSWSASADNAKAVNVHNQFNAVSREDRRKIRVRRLINRLSVTADGYRCYWQVQKYLIGDRCACLCT